MSLTGFNNSKNGTYFGKFMFSKKSLGLTLILCVVGAALNFAVSLFAAKGIKIPLFLDTIFTIAILFYCGILPAAITAFITSIPSSLVVHAPFYILFFICSVVIILITDKIMKYNSKNNNSIKLTILYLILAALLSGFASSIIGGIIHTSGLILFPNKIEEIVTEKFVLSLFSKNGSLLLSSILGRVPSTCIDRIVSNIAGWGVYQLMLKVDKNMR